MNSLRTAVRAACRAYKKSGRMLDAALAYAEHSFPIFPLDPVSKAPIPRRDKDPTGAYPDGIPRTGGHYKATCDADVIRRWWRRTPNALIGMPMGERTGVFTIDVDTPEDHADGVSAWQALAAEHPEFTTREHRSATGGPHLIFLWVEGIRCATGELPGGVEVKGQGGYIAVPPSQRKGRSYTVFRDIDPEPAPKWLLDLILAKQSPAQFSSGEIVDQTELADAMRAIPNDDLDWTDWNNFGMAIWAATGGKGFEIFDEWSAKSPWYGVKETPAERWKAITGSPPNQTGSGKIFKAAGKHGWMPKAATYQLPTYSDLTQARQRLKALTRDFLQQVAIWAEATDTDDATDTAPPPVWAARVGTGIGKTRIAIEELAAWIRANAGTLRGPVVYLVPRHKLGDEILQLFAAQGIDARIFRGRDAENPEQPGWKMCLNPGAVMLARECHAEVATSCCKHKDKVCQFFDRCGYIQQVPEEMPQVWIAAADMLFFRHKAFGKPALVIIDEAFWPKGLRGLSGGNDADLSGEERAKFALPFHRIAKGKVEKPTNFFTASAAEQLHLMRHELVAALRSQQEDGAVTRETLGQLPGGRQIGGNINLEWRETPKFEAQPGMTAAELERLQRKMERDGVIDEIHTHRLMVKIWRAADDVFDNPDGVASGRLKIADEVLSWCGVADIVKQFRVPTLMLDATLPDPAILKIYHPQVEVVADIQVAMPPSVKIRQVLGAPTTKGKLESEKHQQEIRRYIMARYIETGRQNTLVVTQLGYETWLKDSGLPANIVVEHFNNIAGSDVHKDVRLQINVGRTLPGPAAVEAQAGALTGREPIIVKGPPGKFIWYPSTLRAIQLADGSRKGVMGDLHPDPMGEAIRWQICEGEELQAIGRSRGINRTAETPLDIDILTNVVLPITVDEVVQWEIPPSLLIETIERDGVVLTSCVDMVKTRNDVWPNLRAAERTVKELRKNPAVIRPLIAHFTTVSYQLAGPKMKPRIGYFDMARVPDPQAWLDNRLGALTNYVVGGPPL